MTETALFVTGGLSNSIGHQISQVDKMSPLNLPACCVPRSTFCFKASKSTKAESNIH